MKSRSEPFRTEAMSSSTAISIFLRIRPAKKADGYFSVPDAENRVDVQIPASDVPGLINNRKTNWRFSFNGVLTEQATQDEMFDLVCCMLLAPAA